MEVSLFSVGKTILEKLGPLIQQEASLLWNLQTELEKLNGTVTAIQALLLDAEEQQVNSRQVKDWLEKLTVLLFDAEDLLDDVATKALLREADARNQGDDGFNCKVQCWTVVCFLLSFPNSLIYGLKMAHKVKSLREKFDAIYADNTQLHLTPRFEEKGKMRKHTHTVSSIPDIVVGREDDIKKIKKLLLLADSDIVVPIVGIGGMGKTTLAQLIYNDRDVIDEFKLRLWVCVSEDFEVNVIVQKILESATGEEKQDLELSTLTKHLARHISEKKYLLVLDDVWNFNPEKWDALRSVLRSGASGSKILVTTRFENYARRMMSRGSPRPPYTLSGLSSQQSWSLLRQIAFGSGDEMLETTVTSAEEIKSEIMKKSAGVPLAVKTIANLLYFRDPQTEWLQFLRSSELLGAEQEGSILHNLKLSYEYLPSHLKHCFLHCALYPKDYEIRVETLIFQWCALGLIKSSSPNESSQSLLDLGLRCFMDLAWRSFFQEIKRDWSNNIKTCKMHDLIHDLAVSLAGSSRRQITGPIDRIDEQTYHISLSHDLWPPCDIINHLDRAKRLQTFYVPHTDRWYQPGTSWDEHSFRSFVSRFGSLRLLNFSNSGMEMVPQHIQRLKYLRYIDFSFDKKMTRLPNSITMLQNLQVLILNNCESLQELPENINQLVNLWFLNCFECFSLTHMPAGLDRLTRLEKLTWFVVGDGSSGGSKHVGGLDELQTLNNLRGDLNIVNLKRLRLRSSSPSLAFKVGAAANLKGKLLLESLALNWGDGNTKTEVNKWVQESLQEPEEEEDTEWDECLLESLEPYPNLKLLIVFGCKGGRSPSWISSLTNLVTLQLECCRMQHGLYHLQVLPTLKNLILTRLVDLEYMDQVGDHDEATFFPVLEILQLKDCPKLKGWSKEPPQFPKLTKLFLIRCPLVTTMPSFPTLDDQLVMTGTSLQPLLRTLNHRLPCPSSSDGHYYPLSKLKKLQIWRIDHPPKNWLQGFQHLTSLQELTIKNCSGLDETLDWHNIAHVPNITVDGHRVNGDGRTWLDENHWNNFPQMLKV
ncbi:Putative disease resistance protein RGA3 [Linum perenne]